MRKPSDKTVAKRTGVCLVAFHPLVQSRLLAVLQEQPDLTTTVWRDVRTLGTHGANPEVFVVDVGMLPVPLGQFIAGVRSVIPRAKWVLLGAKESDTQIARLILLGIHGFVSYPEVGRRLVRAVRAVAKGKVWIPGLALREFIDVSSRLRQGAARGSQGVSRREQEILGLILHNCSNKEIAAALRISESTVKFHISNMFTRFQVHDRASLGEAIQRQALSGNFVIGAESNVAPGHLGD
jgi:two-component system NarL family response regulator